MSAVLPTHGSLLPGDAPSAPAAPAPKARPDPGAEGADQAARAAIAAPLRSAPSLPIGGGRGWGLPVVIVLHVAIAWALASGLARKVVAKIQQPIEMAVIREAPPPPPRIEKLVELPKPLVPPPPSYVPPPEVVVTAPAPPSTVALVEPPKAPVEIAPAPPASPAPPAPPVAAAPPKPEVVRQDVRAACPGYQNAIATALEDAFDRVGIVGTVRTLLRVRGTQIVDVQQQSGPPEYQKYVQGAVRRMRCNASGADEVQVVLDVFFRK